MTAQGVVRGTGLSRLAESERWDAASVAEVKGVPWDWQGTELTERVPPQALPAPLTWFTAYRERQRLAEAPETVGAVQASEEPAAQAA
eukprot:2494198-Amphidinium_carterae.1